MHRRKKMKRTIYQMLMSMFAGTVTGSVVANLVNIMDPEFQLDYGLSMAFFTAITWALLSVLDAVFSKARRASPAPVPAGTARR